MILHPFRVIRAARAIWARDRSILGPLSGLFLFVPQWAILLLVPDFPAMIDGDRSDAAMTAWTAAFSEWAAHNALTYIVAGLLSQFGTLAVASLYLGTGAGTAGSALGRAAALFGRYLLALVVVWVPVGIVASVLLSVGGAGLAMMMVPVAYIFALAVLMLVAPAVAAGERGAVRAVTHVWTAMRGNRLSLVGLAGVLVFAAQVGAAIPVAVEHSLAARGMANPVVTALLHAGAAGVLWASSLGLALSGVIAYRALAR